MKIATWNINGVKARLDTALTYLKDAHLDVLCLQEIARDEAFPAGAFEELGYNVATHGQKGFNGVAILSKTPLEDVARGLPGAPDGGDAQSRYIEATLSTAAGRCASPPSTCRTAIQSAPRSSTTNSPGWSACTATPGAFSPTRCRSCSLATSTSSPNRSTPSARRPG